MHIKSLSLRDEKINFCCPETIRHTYPNHDSICKILASQIIMGIQPTFLHFKDLVAKEIQIKMNPGYSDRELTKDALKVNFI